jgi:hypothetical protein
VPGKPRYYLPGVACHVVQTTRGPQLQNGSFVAGSSVTFARLNRAIIRGSRGVMKKVRLPLLLALLMLAAPSGSRR